MKNYNTKEISELLNVNIRTVQRHIATLLNDLSNHDRKGVSVPEDLFLLLKNRISGDTSSDSSATSSDTENEDSDGLVAEWFTEEEHEMFMKVIYTEYPVMKKQIEMSNENLNLQKEYIKNLETQIEYFRFSYNKQLEVHEKLIDTFKQRNFIEAKEKGYDKENT